MAETTAPANDGTSLDEHSILGEALAQTGRPGFHDHAFRTPMRMLLRSLDQDANLTAAGRQAMRSRIVGFLVNRLRVEEYLERYPEIRTEQIGPPAVIVGLARTGTTMLHRLLSCDPDANTVAWWENRNPAPFPDTVWGQPDPRIAAAHEEVKAILEAVPDLAAIHPWDPEGPDEEIMLLEHTFYSTAPPSMANVPTYDAWVKQQDQTEAYRHLHLILQFLQWQKRRAGHVGSRWVLKAPHHLGFIEYLFAQFPGAKIIQTHRDPLQTIPSITSMYYSLWHLVCDHPDPLVVGRYCKEHYGRALRHCMEVRDTMPGDRFIDIDYRAVLRDPIAEVRRIYAFLGLTLTPDVAARMTSWLTENRRDRRAPHEYTLEQFGFTAEQICDDFAEYRRRYVRSSE